MKVVIAEKPSVAREIARVFGATTKRDGYIEGKGWTFTWAFGHLLQLASPQAYGFYGWDARLLPMLPQKMQLAVRQSKKGDKWEDDPGTVKQLEVIRKLFEEADEIIVATDAGREGELIFRYIYYYLKCRKPFRRLWISSQTDAAIKDGFRNLRSGTEYDTLFASAHCRAQADWLVGMNATQALSIASGRKGVLSLGRVQTPTLAMICARYRENKDFKPETYFQVRIALDKTGQVFKAVSAKNFKSEEEAQRVLDAVLDAASGHPSGGHIASVEKKLRKEAPPLLHDLSSIQQEANKRLGLSADATLSILQSLYEGKLVTYPRTGSRYIGDDVFKTVPDLIASLKGHPRFGHSVDELIGAKHSKRSVDAKKVTDHHAILITGEFGGALSGDHRAVYELVAGRMLEAFGKECLKEVTKVTVESGSKFLAAGTVIKQPGWRAVFGDFAEESKEGKDEEENQSLPSVASGEDLPVVSKDLLRKQTKPRPLFTEAALLKAMETAGKDIEDEALREAMKSCGLGTPATRAATIETLLKRGYIVREKKSLVPTPVGLQVYEVVKEKAIAHAELTGQWEKRLEEIRSGASVDAFLAEIKGYTAAITRELLGAGQQMRAAAPQASDPLLR